MSIFVRVSFSLVSIFSIISFFFIFFLRFFHAFSIFSRVFSPFFHLFHFLSVAGLHNSMRAAHSHGSNGWALSNDVSLFVCVYGLRGFIAAQQ